jgi:hypothetical protein
LLLRCHHAMGLHQQLRLVHPVLLLLLGHPVQVVSWHARSRCSLVHARSPTQAHALHLRGRRARQTARPLGLHTGPSWLWRRGGRPRVDCEQVAGQLLALRALGAPAAAARRSCTPSGPGGPP